MRIDARVAGGTAGTGAAQAAARPAGAPAFGLAPGNVSRPDGRRETVAARQAAPLATLDALLALQGEEDPGERRRRSARRGQDLLDALDGLKAALLGGAVSAGELRRIADRLATGAGTSGDPRLDGIVADIELRARVELAKLGQA